MVKSPLSLGVRVGGENDLIDTENLHFVKLLLPTHQIALVIQFWLTKPNQTEQ